MKVRHVIVALLSGALLSGASVSATAADRLPAHREGAVCSAAFLGGDARFGPEDLPATGPVGHQLDGYRRLGGMTPRAFLSRFWSPTANSGKGGWIYPPANGYITWPGGAPIEWKQTLRPGRDIDRYGSEYGTFLAPAGLPYADRAIPPQSLDGTPAAGCNYHEYEVLKAFTVESGPIAPWFGQPGRGLQYQLVPGVVPGAPDNVNVGWLVTNGYLERLV